MNRKTIAVFFLLTLVILIEIPESFAYPQYGSSCSACHGNDMGNNNAPIPTSIPTPPPPLGNEMGNNNVTAQVHGSILSIADGNKNVDLTQGNAQTGDTSGLMMDPIRYALGIVGTALVVISQFYSLRKRRR
jgi:hypothetical protein